MAFVAPLIAGVIGAGTIGSALISAGISLGLGYLARRLGPKPGADGGRGMRLSLRLDPNADREILFGTAAVAGTLHYHHSYGPNGNDYIQLVYVLADHECDGLQAVYIDGKQVTLGATASTAFAAGTTVDEYPNAMWLEFHSGAWDQAADAELIARGAGNYTSTDRGRGVCYVRVTMKYDAKLYKTGQPRFLFVVRGAKLYDWRKDSTAGGTGAHRWGTPSTYEWSDNPVVQLYNYRRGVYVGTTKLGGMSTPAAALPVAVWTAAANACDETVGLKAGGTEKRYRSSGIATVATEHRAVITDLVTAMAGVEVDTGGVVRPLPGISQAPVIEIADDDIMARESVEITPRAPRSALINAVFGSFADPAQQFEQIALPPRLSPTDEEADGGIQLSENYALDYVTSGTQGQRVMEIMRRRERHQTRVSLTLRSRLAVLEPGDWVEWTSDRYGFVAALFEVTSATLRADLTVQVELREVSAGIFAWTAATDELDPAAPATVGAGSATFDEIAGLAVGTVTVSTSGAAARPGLNVTWTPITDASVREVLIEYRRVGDTVALQYRDLQPETGTATFITGVQGGVEYEVRALPVTTPQRATVWTGWVSSPDDTAPQVVAVAGEALYIAPENIPPAELDAQSRFELSLATATEEITGSLSQQVSSIIADMRAGNIATMRSLALGSANRARITIERTERLSANEAFAQQITTALAQIDETQSSVTQEITARAQGDAALAQSITSLTTTVNGQTVTVNILAASIDGIEGRVGLAVNANGQVVGLALLEGTALGSAFTVVADKFQIAQPGVNGGAVVPVFTIANVAGVPKLVFRGDMFADGTIAARALNVATLSALSADLGNVVAGLWSSQDGKMLIDGRAGQPKRLRIVS